MQPSAKAGERRQAAVRLTVAGGTLPSDRSRSTSFASVAATTPPRKKSPLSSSDLLVRSSTFSMRSVVGGLCLHVRDQAVHWQ